MTNRRGRSSLATAYIARRPITVCATVGRSPETSTRTTRSSAESMYATWVLSAIGPSTVRGRSHATGRSSLQQALAQAAHSATRANEVGRMSVVHDLAVGVEAGEGADGAGGERDERHPAERVARGDERLAGDRHDADRRRRRAE